MPLVCHRKHKMEKEERKTRRSRNKKAMCAGTAVLDQLTSTTYVDVSPLRAVVPSDLQQCSGLLLVDAYLLRVNVMTLRTTGRCILITHLHARETTALVIGPPCMHVVPPRIPTSNRTYCFKAVLTDRPYIADCYATGR